MKKEMSRSDQPQEMSLAPRPTKLIEAVAKDYPGTEIGVSFSDEWRLVHRFRSSSKSLYLAGMPPSQERGRSDHFLGLPPEINCSLTTYRLYKLFEPWSTPLFQVAWNSYLGEGRIIGRGKPQVQLQPRGQAQVWIGETYGVLWESYLFSSQQQDNWPEKLIQFWQAVEKDMAVQTIFTHPHEPDFAGDYRQFLCDLGYEPHPEFERWWVKHPST